MVDTVLIAKPRGFCAGVARAVDVVEKALEVYGSPLYVKHAIVHNVHVVEDLEKKGAIFVETIDEIPRGANAVFSAHGSPPEDYRAALLKAITIIDATCPLVSKVHLEAKSFAQKGYTIIYVGHRGHPEGIGVKGEVDTLGGQFYLLDDINEAKASNITADNIAILTQTTLSLSDTKEILDILKEKYPHAAYPPKKDICYATENRQQAVKLLAKKADVILVVGSKTSSNSNRLREVAEETGAKAYLIDDASFIKNEWLKDAQTVGITAGASAPEYLIDQLKNYFKKLGVKSIKEHITLKENVFFPLPQVLQKQIAA